MREDFVVSIRCLTYNQAAYIIDAMNGFVMQQTSFPFLVVIVDDASTDGEQKVIKAYVDEHFCVYEEDGFTEWETEDANWTLVRHKVNENCFFLIVNLKRNLYGNPKKWELIKEWMDTKYMTFCEGDDYWTDEYRLQRMTFFLESHPRYVLVTHRINRYNEATGEMKDDRGNDVYYGKKKGFSFGRYYNRFIHWQTQTLRTMYRKDIYDKATRNYPYPKTDGVLSYLVLKYGRGYGINEYMGTYRIQCKGVWSGISSFEKQYSNLIMFRNFYHFDKSLFAMLSYYAKYIDVYKRYPEELKSKEPIKSSIALFNVVYAPFLYVKKKWFKIKRKLLRISK